MPSSRLEPDFQEPFTAWQQDPSKENTTTMVTALDPVLRSAVRTYAGPSASSPTIKSHAKRLAIDALGSYDPAKGPMRSHMMSRLQRLRRVSARQRQIISMPEQVGLDQMLMTRATTELEDRLNRAPSDEELSNHTGLSAKRIQYIRTGMRPMATGTITRMGAEGTGGYDPSVQQLGEEPDSWAELVYSDLEPTNQFIMERVLGMHAHQQMRPGEVARLLKISPAAVSHRMAQIQQKLDRREELAMV